MSERDQLAARVHRALQMLADAKHGEARRGDVWNGAVRQVALTPEEAEETKTKGRIRGMTNFMFAASDLVNAGLITRQRGLWTITDAGRAAARTSDADALLDEVVRKSRTVQRERRAARAVTLADTILPPTAGANQVRDAGRVFVERGLRDLDSVFATGRRVWRREVVQELLENFVDRDLVEDGAFGARLSQQLGPVSDDAKLLMAELALWQALPLKVPGEMKKRQRVTTILESMDRAVVIPRVLDESLRAYAFNAGRGMSSNLYRGLALIVRLLDAWLVLTAEVRQTALDDPWAWRDFVLGLPGTAFPTQRYELLYLVHPETFGEVIAPLQRQAIVDAFAGELDEVSGDVDLDFLNVTLALQQKDGGPVRYYDAPHHAQWAGTDPEDRQDDEDGRTLEDVTRSGRSAFPRAGADLAARLHIDEPWLDRTLALIQRRQQVIFYGPPGTGKTFLARALAEHVTDATTGSTTIVQFHPTYSYEDFFEGFRPSTGADGQQLGFSLRRGPLRRLADEAAVNPEANYFLVIDEINRGNLAKIFGELYYLLEYRDSEIALLYSEEPFTLPSNIFFIGTMNTADRSIAMLDAAMRRRFAFVELHPETAPVAGLLGRWTSPEVTDQRDLLLDELNRRIVDHDAKIGPSFLMRDLPGEELDGVWTYEILPLLAEYHYADGTDIEARYGIGALRRALRTAAADAPAGSRDGDA